MHRRGRLAIVTALSSLMLMIGSGCAKEMSSEQLEAHPADTALRVMQLNLLSEEYAHQYPDRPWSSRLPIVKELLLQEQPDLIGTQEGTRSQLEDLEAGLPGYKWIGVGRERSGGGQFMAVLYNSERLKPLQERHFWLSDTPDTAGSTSWGNRQPRMVTWVLFEERTTGLNFYLLNTHLDHHSEIARTRSAELLAETILAFDPDIPVLVTGDFNSRVGFIPYSILTVRAGLQDALKDAEEQIHYDIGTVHHFTDFRSGRTIDWILYRGDLDVVRSETVLFNKDGQYPSDHYPVMADVRIRGWLK